MTDSSYKPTKSVDRSEISKALNTSKEINRFKAWQETKMRPKISGDEYTRYCNAEVIPDIVNIRSWWQERTQLLNYPNLSIIALDILSIPAMAADLERLFSGAKISITDRRNRLGIETIEALEYLKSWLQLDGTDWGEERLVGGWKLVDKLEDRD